uniref:Uncharacterized protein n=1 Tax=Balbiania investiens TaxID=111861 RepID=A0A4D6BNI3_9FLOR
MPFYTESRLKSKFLYLDKFDHLDRTLISSSFILPTSHLNAQILPNLSQPDKLNFILMVLFANLICGQKPIFQDDPFIKTHRLKSISLNTSIRNDKLFNLFEACLSSVFVTNSCITTLVSLNPSSLWSVKVQFSSINDFMIPSSLSNQLISVINPSSYFFINFYFGNLDLPQNNFVPT